MAGIFWESFDGYSTAQLTRGRWNSVAASQFDTVAVSPGTGRYGTQSLRLTSGAVNSRVHVRKTFAQSATWLVGLAYQASQLESPRDILSLRDNGTTQVDLVLRVDGTLEVTRGGTVLGVTSSGATTITAQTYYFLELKAVIHASAGSVQVRINGQTLLALSGVNTQVGGVAAASELLLGNVRLDSGGGYTMDYDDVYVLDGSGPAPHNAFLGDCRVICLLPVGQELAEFTPTTAPNWSCVDEVPPDVVDYTEGATVGQRDRFQYAALPALVNPVLYGAQLSLYCTNPDVGPRLIAAHALSGGQELDGASQALPGTYTYLQDRFARDPQGALWTPTSLQAARFGYKIVG